MFDFDLMLLSTQFMQAYPTAQYPELMHKQGRPYTCLLIETHYDYFICIPFRSSISHKNAFMFQNTARSKRSKSGLDYSKIVIIKNTQYLDSKTTVIVDPDEYREMMIHINTIKQEAEQYVEGYANHITGKNLLHPKQFVRKYQYSTLPYFHDVLGI